MAKCVAALLPAMPAAGAAIGVCSQRPVVAIGGLRWKVLCIKLNNACQTIDAQMHPGNAADADSFDYVTRSHVRRDD